MSSSRSNRLLSPLPLTVVRPCLVNLIAFFLPSSLLCFLSCLYLEYSSSCHAHAKLPPTTQIHALIPIINLQLVRDLCHAGARRLDKWAKGRNAINRLTGVPTTSNQHVLNMRALTCLWVMQSPLKQSLGGEGEVNLLDAA